MLYCIVLYGTRSMLGLYVAVFVLAWIMKLLYSVVFLKCVIKNKIYNYNTIIVINDCTLFGTFL